MTLDLLLDALCKRGLVDYAEAMCKKVKDKVKLPDANKYFFFRRCEVRNLKIGMQILEEIQIAYISGSFTSNIAIIPFAKQGRRML